MNHQEGVALVKFLNQVHPEDTFIVTTKAFSSYLGKTAEFNDRRVYYLSKSNGGGDVNKDELFQKLKPTVLHTAHKTAEQARDQIYDHCKELYPQYNVNVWVCQAGQMGHSGFSNEKASALFQTSENKFYGHDVLVILK